MEILQEYDVVRIKALLLSESERMILGSNEIKRKPVLGDIGTIVHIPQVRGGDTKIFIVECTNNEGKTYWISDFTIDELELVWKYAK
jgi:hypothetical protein